VGSIVGNVIEDPFGPPVPEVPLPHAPLVHVIAQVRFPPVLTIEEGGSFLGPFQEALRHEYPVLRPEAQVGVVVGPQGPLKQQQQTVWWFLQAEGPWRVGLANDFVALSADRYTNRAEFLARFADVLRALDQWLQPKQLTRLGVRYVSRVRDDALLGRLGELVRPEVLGPAAVETGDAHVQRRHSIADVEYAGEDGSALHARWGVLPALATMDPALPPIDVPSFVLDVDVYRLGPESFSPVTVRDAAADYCARQYRFFRWAVTDEYLRAFGGQV
jgi:uncharacterized protein (TIGR04255 family)